MKPKIPKQQFMKCDFHTMIKEPQDRETRKIVIRQLVRSGLVAELYKGGEKFCGTSTCQKTKG